MENFVCKECGEEKTKDNFYPHPGTINKILSRCKECIKKGRRSPEEREKARNWETQNRIRPEGYLYERTKEYRKNEREKSKAHQKVNNFLRSHKDEYDFKCIICNSGEKIELHHEDYNHQNEVIPFCSLHHKRYHCGDFKIDVEKNKIILGF